MSKKTLLFLAATSLLVVIFLGVSQVLQKNSFTSPAQNAQLSVVASFYPVAYFTQQIGGELIDVRTLVSPGLEPHDFEPTPQDLVALQKAQLFVYHGAGAETWAERVTAEIPKEKIVEATAGISLLTSDDNKTADPHVWMSPLLAIQEVKNILAGLSRVDPPRQQAYQQRAIQLENKLRQLDVEFAQGLASCKQHTIVTSHNAFAYLARQYGIQVVSIAGLSPDEEPTPQKLAAVSRLVKEQQVRYIFFETLVSPKLSETIAQETGAEVMTLNPLEGLTVEEVQAGQDYFSIQRQNLQNLRQALECK